MRLAIPADVRHVFGGKVEFVPSTRKKDEAEANAMAAPTLFGWKRQIEAVRQALQQPDDEKRNRLAAKYRTTR